MPHEAVREEIDELFTQWDRDDSPGCALTIIQDGEPVYTRGYGMAHLEQDVPVSPASIFDIGSVSKQFTAMAILLLDDAGTLSLDDDVRKHVPELPDYGATITVRHLVHHTSGLRDYLALLNMAGWRGHDLYTEGDALDVITSQKGLNFEPGTQYRYSNSGYILMAIIVERASGKTLANYAEEKIFRPLGMTRTHFHDDHTLVVKGRTQAYDKGDDGRFTISIPVNDLAGDGSLHTTVEDLARWHRNFEDPVVGGPALIERMLTPGRLNDGTELDYAFGIHVGEYRGTRAISHSGVDAGYRAHYLHLPGHRLAVACLCNLSSMEPARLARQVVDVILAGKLTVKDEAAARVDIPEAELVKRASFYRNPATGEIVQLRVESGKLLLGSGAGREFEAVSSDQFQASDDPAQVITFTGADGGFEMTLGYTGGQVSSYVPVPGVKPTPADLASYQGTYYSEEVGSSCTIVAEENTLVLRRRKFEDSTYTAATADTFVSNGARLEFMRDGEQVTGFTLNTYRANGIQFDRTQVAWPTS